MFNLIKERLGETTVLHCSGRIVFPDADALRTAVLQLPRSRKLVLDLADVITIDAAGLGVFVSLYHWAKGARTELKLMNVGSRVQRLLEITQLNSILECCSGQEILGLLYCSSGESAVGPLQEFSPAASRVPQRHPFSDESGGMA